MITRLLLSYPKLLYVLISLISVLIIIIILLPYEVQVNSESYTAGLLSDKFGIEMIYPSKIGGEIWFIDMQDPLDDDRIFSDNEINKNKDGSLNSKDSKIRINVVTSGGYKPDIIKTTDQEELSNTGYLQSFSDWKNVEMTGFIKIKDYANSKDSGDDDYDDFAWSVRGGKHNQENICEGTGYIGRLFYSGQTGFAKEQYQKNGFTPTPTKQSTDSLLDRWIGFKFIVYNIHNDNGSDDAVKLEIWIDDNSDGRNWTKASEIIDNGRWGNSGQACGGKDDQIISWGGPVAIFRWDSAEDVDFKYFSVREINVNI